MPRKTNSKPSRGVFEKVKGSGVWWVLYYDQNGKRHRERVGPKSLAIEVYRKRKTEVAEAEFFPEKIAKKRRRTLVEDAIQEYLKMNSNKAVHVNDLRYGRIWIQELKGKTLEEVAPLDVERYQKRRAQEVAVATVNREVQFVRRVFNVAIRNEKLDRNPVSKLKMFKENNERVRFLSDEEEQRLQDAYVKIGRAEDWIFVQIAMHTGMRRGEQFNLRWENVNLQAETITIPRSKNGEARRISISEYVQDLFRSLPSRMRNEWCFPHSKGTGPLDGHNVVTRSFYPALAEAGIEDFHWHDLRHTFASRLVMAEVDLPTVRDLMGHKSIQMTLRYSHLSPAHTRKAVNKLKPGVGHPEPKEAVSEPTATATATSA